MVWCGMVGWGKVRFGKVGFGVVRCGKVPAPGGRVDLRGSAVKSLS